MTTQNPILVDIPDDLPHQEWNEREWIGVGKKYPVSSEVPTFIEAARSKVLTLHMGTYALLLSDQFLRTLTATPTLSQDGRTLTLDDTQLQIFNELWGKLQDILRVVKAVVVARKKGRGGAGDVEMDTE